MSERPDHLSLLPTLHPLPTLAGTGPWFTFVPCGLGWEVIGSSPSTEVDTGPKLANQGIPSLGLCDVFRDGM